MAEKFFDHDIIHSSFEQPRCKRMTQVMEVEFVHPCPFSRVEPPMLEGVRVLPPPQNRPQGSRKKKYGDAWIENTIREANDTSNPGLPRTAFKMATGSSKTVVMAMLIAWHTLNKRANPQDARFSDTFLIVTPGITIRDRLRVLLPNDPENYYRQRDIVLAQLQEELGQAKMIITNYHTFQLREKVAAGKITKSSGNLGGAVHA